MQGFGASGGRPSAGLTFPPGFLWGTATSAHQVEGDNTNNDWWAWEHQAGRIAQGHRSGRAGDWWRAAEADFDRMAALHQNAHRLSVEWSRLEPQPGRWDERALRRYREMLAGLRRRAITPMITLHHFTFPLWVARRGGWLWNAFPGAFGRFARRTVEALGDLADLWCTLNEPVAAIISGYLIGRFPPGGGGLLRTRVAVVNAVRAHAAAYHAIHAAQPAAQVGIAAYLRVFDPARPASRLDRLVAGAQDRVVNWMFLDALRDGVLRGLWQTVRIPESAGSLDFIGVNYYTRDLVRFDPRAVRTLFGRNTPTPGAPLSDGGYGEIYPVGLFRVLEQVRAYGRPIYITENGLPDADDDLRPAFLVSHLREAWRALQEGADIRGYFHWSLIDNFEWADGWTLRFGLIGMDPATQVRTPRPSSALYAEICRTGSVMI
ncbi:MAG: glycoside hydrolase family 1 protein [Armatimonadetes bacterium]|nr:glycoside hydrolase family 1 protein [Armatimonadota bacterium]